MSFYSSMVGFPVHDSSDGQDGPQDSKDRDDNDMPNEEQYLRKLYPEMDLDLLKQLSKLVVPSKP